MFFSSRALDSFDQYLQDVEKYPLIEDPAQERALARRARNGDKEAAERLVTANLRFVISYVKKYQGAGWACPSWCASATRGCSRRSRSSIRTRV
jgi:RNA polymerase primary sigma factor